MIIEQPLEFKHPIYNVLKSHLNRYGGIIAGGAARQIFLAQKEINRENENFGDTDIDIYFLSSTFYRNKFCRTLSNFAKKSYESDSGSGAQAETFIYNDVKITVLDFECTFQVKEKNKKDPSPYNIDNYLVSYGVWHQDQIIYKCLKHNHKATDPDAHPLLQSILDKTDLLIAFNAKFELSWLKACGFTYNGAVFDPMLGCYVLARGQKFPLNLAACCVRFGVEEKKSELVEGFLKENIGFEEIPWDIVEEYGIGDITSTLQLYHAVIEELNKSKHLWPTVNLMNEFCVCLTDIETNGIKIDIEALDSLDKEYTKELNTLNIELQLLVKEVMGCTPINLESPEHLSQVLFSRKITDKKAWKEVFNLGTELRGSVIKPKRRPKMSTAEFVNNVRQYTEIIYKTTAIQCIECKGAGKIQRIKVDGSPFVKQSGCIHCGGNGILYLATKEIAGFRFIPSGAEETAVGGFSTSGDVLERLLLNAKGKPREFLTKYKRINQISTYLSTFVGGIRRGIDAKDILHPSYMQHVVATGRLSSRNPNFQNQPRGNTFPVRRCIVSRFTDGCILSGDAKQLEFRIAGELSKDKQIFEDVIAGIDVHAKTSEHTGYSRQDSKPYTFAPVYGASERGKAEHIARYFRYFKQRYAGLFAAHISWGNIVLETGSFVLPSGREFIYPNTKRYPSGGISNSTIIANYPVQAFATADLMPIFCINTWKLYKEYNLKSLIILEVHDDVSVDVYPGELEIAAKLMVQAFNSIPEECIDRYDYKLEMPLEVELKVGPNWLEQKEYHV